MTPVEIMSASDGDDRTHYLPGTPEFGSVVASVTAKFGQVYPEDWHSVSSPQWNSIYNDHIVSVIFLNRPTYFGDAMLLAVGRKYFMDKGWVYDKIYPFVTKDNCPIPYPSGGSPLALGYMVNVYGQPGDADLTRYKDVYFMHPDHAAVEQWAGMSLPKGKYATFYAATFDTLAGANKLLRMKTYVYDDQTPYSDWDVSWLRMAKHLGVVDTALGL